MKKTERLPLAVSTLAIQLPRELRAMSWWVLFLSRNLPAVNRAWESQVHPTVSEHIHTACLHCGGNAIQY